ncbi:MAG: GNAT family N-acetyltransferase [bacterium]
MISLRCMTQGDLHRVNLILSKSFTHASVQDGYRPDRIPLCRIEFLEMYLASCPDGSFVIEKDGEIIAYSFSRLWGTVGWIGPLSVIPAQEGHGYGKEVVSACIEFLNRNGAQTIGLEMPSHSNRNLGFYTKLGFVPDKLTVDFVRHVFPKASQNRPTSFESVKFSKIEPIRAEKFLTQMRQLSNSLEPGLDYTREVQLATEYGFGDACLLTKDQAALGFVLAHTEPYSQEEVRQYLKINVLQMSSDLPINTLDAFLEEIEDWARTEYLTEIYLRVPTRYCRGYEYIAKRDFKIVHSDLRMTLNGFSQRDDPNAINFSKWE